MAKIVEFQCMNLEDRDPYEIGPDQAYMTKELTNSVGSKVKPANQWFQPTKFRNFIKPTKDLITQKEKG